MFFMTRTAMKIREYQARDTFRSIGRERKYLMNYKNLPYIDPQYNLIM